MSYTLRFLPEVEGDFEKLGIDAQLRAENLGVVEFAQIANFLGEKA